MSEASDTQPQASNYTSASLQKVLRTDELRFRAYRLPDFESENKALIDLMQVMLESPEKVLETLAQTALRLCHAHSTGISVLEEENGVEVFRWRAVAGQFSKYLGASLPRNASPCGTVLDCNCSQLMGDLELHFPLPPELQPRVTEVLLAPFYVDGKPRGTVWAVAHDDSRKFDREDERVLSVLGRFVSNVHQVADNKRTENLLSVQKRVLEMLATSATLSEVLEVLIRFAEEQSAGMLGSIFIRRPAHDDFYIGVAPSYPPGFTEAFVNTTVLPPYNGPCGMATHLGTSVVCNDIAADRRWSKAWTDIALGNGARSCYSVPIPSADGRILGAFGMCYSGIADPTRMDHRVLELVTRVAGIAIERRQRDDALRDSEERFHALADNISQFAWMADSSGAIFWYNKRWFDYTGSTLEEMKGCGWKRVHHPDHVDRVVARIQHSWNTGEIWEDTFPLRGKDGTYRWFLSRAEPIRDAAGKVVRWFGTNTDIDDQRRARKELQEADRRKSDFLAMLAHELRNPLGPISNAVHLLTRHASADPMTEKLSDVLNRQLTHMTRMIGDLLDVSRVSQGKLALSLARVDLAEIVRTAVADYRPILEKFGQDLNLSLPEGPVWFDGDAIRLSQAISNLLHNANKFSNPGGVVDVELTCDTAHAIATLRVRDRGMGIDAQFLPHLFDAFTQDERSLYRKNGGLGLGLALVRGLVELHGGSVQAHSGGVGMGSEFVIVLPLNRSARISSVQLPAAAPAVIKRKILLIEDNVDAAETMRMLLELDGHTVSVAGDGATGIKLAQQDVPHVIFCDIGLPGMSGYDVAKEIRRQPLLSAVHLVALTGYGQPSDIRRTASAGFNRHIVKPVAPGAIEEILSQSLYSPAL